MQPGSPTPQRRPHVIALAAITADGKIARGAGDPATWTSREDKRMFVSVTKRAGAVVVGRTTFETFPQPLRDRLQVVLTSSPDRYTSTPGIVEYHNGAPAEVLSALAERGFAEVVVAGGARVYAEYLGSGSVDELWLTVEPMLFGRGISLCEAGLPADVRLQLREVVRLSEHTVQLQYGVGAP